MEVWVFFTSPSTRSLARPPRDATAAPARTRDRSSAHSGHSDRLTHTTVLVEVLCAHNGSQHHHKHKSTQTSSTRPLSSPCRRARTRSDASDDASAIAHARTASHKPHVPSKAQQCIMSGTQSHRPPRTATCQHVHCTPREHGDTARHTRAHAAKAATQHATAGQRRRCKRHATPAAFPPSSRARSKLAWPRN